MAKLRFIGPRPLTFADSRIGSKEPGDEFTVPDEDAPALLASPYLVEVVEEETSETPEVTTKTDTDESPLKEVYGAELPDSH